MNATKEKLVVLEKKEKKSKARMPRARRKSGAAKMREAADKVVGRDCKPILRALSKDGKNGNILSAKFLYQLAHSAEEAGEAHSAEKFRKMALELTNSPEWKGEPAEEDDDEAVEE